MDRRIRSGSGFGCHRALRTATAESFVGCVPLCNVALAGWPDTRHASLARLRIRRWIGNCFGRGDSTVLRSVGKALR